MSEKVKSKNNKLFHEAITCLLIGYFEGALIRARKIEMTVPSMYDKGLHISWFAGAYLGGSNLPSAKLNKSFFQILQTLSGGQGIAEGAMVAAETGRLDLAADGIQSTLKTARAQHGVLVMWHPAALLRLAAFSLYQLNDKTTSRYLVNCAIGTRSVYAILDDVKRLSELLVALDAPKALWVDWGAIFLQHIQFANYRVRICEEELHDSRAVQWALEQETASEQVLRNVILNAPIELIPLLKRLSPHMNAEEFVNVVSTRFQAPNSPPPSTLYHSTWFDDDALRFRYFWYDMVTPSEQNLLKNGDWAIFYTPTSDFSMGVAQWWRVLESVLKRGISKPLSKLFAEHPEWVEWDQANLNKKQREKESIFVDKLANPKKASRLTLGDLILVLNKCSSADGWQTTGGTGSRLRSESTRFLNLHNDQLQPIMQSRWLNPVHLTNENINWFRNRASHDDPMDFIDASIGRFLAKRVLDAFFRPVLNKWGFIPRI